MKSPCITGKYDGNMLTGAGEGAKLILIVGWYHFDHNPFIGTMAEINVWNRLVVITL